MPRLFSPNSSSSGSGHNGGGGSSHGPPLDYGRGGAGGADHQSASTPAERRRNRRNFGFIKTTPHKSSSSSSSSALSSSNGRHNSGGGGGGAGGGDRMARTRSMAERNWEHSRQLARLAGSVTSQTAPIGSGFDDDGGDRRSSSASGGGGRKQASQRLQSQAQAHRHPQQQTPKSLRAAAVAAAAAAAAAASASASGPTSSSSSSSSIQRSLRSAAAAGVTASSRQNSLRSAAQARISVADAAAADSDAHSVRSAGSSSSKFSNLGEHFRRSSGRSTHGGGTTTGFGDSGSFGGGRSDAGSFVGAAGDPDDDACSFVSAASSAYDMSELQDPTMATTTTTTRKLPSSQQWKDGRESRSKLDRYVERHSSSYLSSSSSTERQDRRRAADRIGARNRLASQQYSSQTTAQFVQSGSNRSAAAAGRSSASSDRRRRAEERKREEEDILNRLREERESLRKMRAGGQGGAEHNDPGAHGGGGGGGGNGGGRYATLSSLDGPIDLDEVTMEEERRRLGGDDADDGAASGGFFHPASPTFLSPRTSASKSVASESEGGGGGAAARRRSRHPGGGGGGRARSEAGTSSSPGDGGKSVYSMPTFPSNSSMQSSFASRQSGGGGGTGDAGSSAGGPGRSKQSAAARRRMRSQIAASKASQASSATLSSSGEASSYRNLDDSSSAHDPHHKPAQAQAFGGNSPPPTPPHRASSFHEAQFPASQVQVHHQHGGAAGGTGRPPMSPSPLSPLPSLGKPASAAAAATATPSAASSQSSFNAAASGSSDGGDGNDGDDPFSAFDAFGLDARAINEEVNAALAELAGTNPELSFFIERDRDRQSSSVASGDGGSTATSTRGGGSTLSTEVEGYRPAANEGHSGSTREVHGVGVGGPRGGVGVGGLLPPAGRNDAEPPFRTPPARSSSSGGGGRPSGIQTDDDENSKLPSLPGGFVGQQAHHHHHHQPGPFVSVDQSSDSSSLTSRSSERPQGSSSSSSVNRFKEAARAGSTYHRAKRVVRPKEGPPHPPEEEEAPSWQRRRLRRQGHQDHRDFEEAGGAAAAAAIKENPPPLSGPDPLVTEREEAFPILSSPMRPETSTGSAKGDWGSGGGKGRGSGVARRAGPAGLDDGVSSPFESRQSPTLETGPKTRSKAVENRIAGTSFLRKRGGPVGSDALPREGEMHDARKNQEDGFGGFEEGEEGVISPRSKPPKRQTDRFGPATAPAEDPAEVPPPKPLRPPLTSPRAGSLLPAASASSGGSGGPPSGDGQKKLSGRSLSSILAERRDRSGGFSAPSPFDDDEIPRQIDAGGRTGSEAGVVGSVAETESLSEAGTSSDVCPASASALAQPDWRGDHSAGRFVSAPSDALGPSSEVGACSDVAVASAEIASQVASEVVGAEFDPRARSHETAASAEQNRVSPPAPLQQERIVWLQEELGDEIQTPETMEARKRMENHRPVAVKTSLLPPSYNGKQSQRKAASPQNNNDAAEANSGALSEIHVVRKKMESKRNYRINREKWLGEAGLSPMSQHSQDSGSSAPLFGESVTLRRSPREESSSAAGSTNSPGFLASVKLKKTGISLDKTKGERVDSEARDENGNENASSEMKGGEDQENMDPINSEQDSAQSPQVPQDRKLTYRERREMELREEQIRKDREAAAQKEAAEKERDVAKLIRERIANNRRAAVVANETSEGKDPTSPTGELANVRSRLRKVTLKEANVPKSEEEQSDDFACPSQEKEGRNSGKTMENTHPIEQQVMQEPAPRHLGYREMETLQAHQVNSPRETLVTAVEKTSESHDMPSQAFRGGEMYGTERHCAQEDSHQKVVSDDMREHELCLENHNQKSQERRAAPSSLLRNSTLHTIEAPLAHETSTSREECQHVISSEHIYNNAQHPSPVPYEESQATSKPVERTSSIISDEGKNKLSALFASRSASFGSQPPEPKLNKLPESYQSPKGSAKDCQGSSMAPETSENISTSSAAAAAAASAALMKMKQQQQQQKQGTPSHDSGSEATSSFVGETGTSNKTDSSLDGRPPLRSDPKYAKYFKMLKIGMPLDVVKHALERDGLDPDVMDGDHDKPEGWGADAGLPLKDDPKYSKYFRMLKMGLPLEAVKHSMQRDGLDPSLMDGDHSKPAGSNAAGRKGKNDLAKSPRQRDTHRRTRLHWDTLCSVRQGSVWAMLEQDQDVDDIEIDETEFAELFQQEKDTAPSNKRAKGKGSGGSKRKKAGAVKVIDPKRANNGGIILARLKMGYDDMARAVDTIDESVMTAEQMRGIVDFMPNSEERSALREFMTEGGPGGSAERFDSLCECEKFMVAMMTVRHSKRKLRALLFKLQFSSCLQELEHEGTTIERACDELSNSVRLRKLLGIVLNIGNRLNTAGSRAKGKAGAFTLDSLLKLNQAKAFDKKTTFLHYVVLVVQRNNELLIRFKDDLPTVLKADKVYWDQCLSDLEEVEEQLENVRKIALYQARSLHKEKRRKKQGKNDTGDGNDSDSMSDVSLSLEEEVGALRSTKVGIFTLDAIKKVSSLRDKVEKTRTKFAHLLEYFGYSDKDGEAGGGMQPHELFQIISTFCRDFDKAREEVAENEKLKMRKERNKRQIQQASSKSPETLSSEMKPQAPRPAKNSAAKPCSEGSPARPQSEHKRKSAPIRVSMMQPSLSSVFGELLKKVPTAESKAQPEKSPQPATATSQVTQSPTYLDDTAQRTPQTKSKKNSASTPVDGVTEDGGDIHQADISPCSDTGIVLSPRYDMGGLTISSTSAQKGTYSGGKVSSPAHKPHSWNDQALPFADDGKEIPPQASTESVDSVDSPTMSADGDAGGSSSDAVMRQMARRRRQRIRRGDSSGKSSLASIPLEPNVEAESRDASGEQQQQGITETTLTNNENKYSKFRRHRDRVSTVRERQRRASRSPPPSGVGHTIGLQRAAISPASEVERPLA